MTATTFLIVLVLADHWAAPAATAVALLCAGVYVVTRPEPPRSAESGEDEEAQP